MKIIKAKKKINSILAFSLLLLSSACVKEIDNYATPTSVATVNDIKELMKFSEDDVENLPPIINEAGNVYMTKVVKKDDEIISILDLHMILTDEELKKLIK